MISKGTTHNNGTRLARYMTTGKEGERAELWQLSGFAANDIRDAFRSVHVMAEATRCEQPFFHCQIRNPEDEELTRDQWLHVANRIESKLGLTGQPRAIAFHTDLKTGHEHMHVAWSRIDDETLTARPLPFFKERLKQVSRELERDLGLTRVRNERDGPVMAPTRNEFEQARRLGVNIHEVRQTIRDCFEHSDNGRSFEAALADHGFVLAKGDRRDFVVIDHEGGMHTPGKRILGVTAAQVRDRLGDLNREQLPTVEHARRLMNDRQLGKENTRSEPMRDPDRDEMAWQDAVAKAAIEKEKIERRFVEPKAERKKAGGRENAQGDPPRTPPENVRGTAAQIWTAYHNSNNPKAFAATLDQRHVLLAAVTKEEADRSHREAAFARAVGNRAPVYREGEIVAVTEPRLLRWRQGEVVEGRRVYQLDKYTTGEDQAKIEKFMATLDRKQLQGIDATKEILNTRAAERGAFWDQTRLGNAQRINPAAPTLTKDPTKAPRAVGKVAGRGVVALGGAVERGISGFAGGLADMFDPPPRLTPEQLKARAEAQEERQGRLDFGKQWDMEEREYRAQFDAQERERQEREAEENNRKRQRGERDR
jgi:hypothetical protein